MIMNIALLLVGFGFLGMGLVALIRPAAIGRFFDVKFDSVDGRNEVRAVYGGFGLAMTLALALAYWNPPLRAGVLCCVSLALAGMAAGRVYSALFERPGYRPWMFCGIESAAALSLWFSQAPA